MPDFEQALKARLGPLELAPQVADEVFAELAEHLEDLYKSHLAAGIVSEEAELRALREIPDGAELARKIHRAKRGEETMNNRTKQIWMPGLVTSGLATCLLAIFENLGMKPAVLSTRAAIPTLFYLPWLLSLPVFGFVGAYWSRRAGGGTGARIIAGVFTSFIYLALPFPLWSLALVVDPRTPRMAVLGWFWCLLNWAVLPCLALLVGALPATFIGSERKQQILA
ncbi:MAG TPA: hypothetical protein VGT03_00895 [Candidatus Acidoferrales bacterium]|nr:hypothetical protein [Candidatus Acidoferrales bacterium]